MFTQLPFVDPQTHTATITATETLTTDSKRIQKLTPSGGSVDVVLPPVAQNAGLHYLIINASGAQTLVVKDADGNTVMTVLPTMSGVVLVDEDETWQILFNSGTYSAVTLTAPTINGASSASGNFDLSGSSGTFKSCTGANQLSGAVTIAAATTPYLVTASGKTNTGYLQVNGKTSGAVKVTCADAAAFTLTVNAAAQSGAATLTIPDLGGADKTIATLTGAETLTNKTLTSPVINGLTVSSGNMDFSGSTGTFKTSTGANTLGGDVTISGSKTFATGTGAVTLNGDVTISGTKALTTGTGTVTVNGDVSVAANINAACVAGTSAFDWSLGTGVFKTSTGANTLSGAVTIADATTPSLTTASGKTNTGYLQVNGKTSGALKLTTADATAYTVTVTTAAQTTGVTTLTIPNFNNVADTFAFCTLAQTFAGIKTFTGGIVLSGAVDLQFSGTTGQPEIVVPDNVADALSIKDDTGGADILVITTTNGSEAVTVTPLLTGAKIQPTASAVTATNDGLTTGLIPSGASHVTVTCDNADKIITLPAAVAGTIIRVHTAATGCEVRTVAASNVKINNVDCDGGAAEMALVADALFTFVAISTTEWIVTGVDGVGAAIATLTTHAV